MSVTPSIGKKASHGAAWVGMARIFSQVIRLGVGAVLAHLLSPDQFGVVAMAMFFSGFMMILSDAGLRSSVVQFKEMTQEGLSTLFWFGVSLGAVCSFLLSLSSGAISEFSNISPLKEIIPVLSLGLLFSAASAVPLGLLQKQMLFKKTAIIEMTSEVVAGVIAVILSLSGARYWALVAQTLTSSALAATFYFFCSRWRPSCVFSFVAVTKSLSFSGNIIGFNVVNYWARSLDTFLIGRQFGSASLGYYNRAYSLMMYPYSMLQSVLSPIIHPAFSDLKEDVDRLRSAYYKVIKLVMTISFPLTVTLGVLASPLVKTLWGPQWDQSVPIFQILCFVSAIQPVYAITGNVYLSLNRADLYFRVGILYVIAICTSMIVGIQWGVKGLAVGYAISNVTIIPLVLFFVITKLLKGRPAEIASQVLLPVIASGVVGIAVAGWKIVMQGLVNPFFLLFGGVTLSIVTLLTLILKLDLPFLVEVAKIAPDKIGNVLMKLIACCSPGVTTIADEK
jgi:PST family polysaccharide transporter